MVSDPFERKTVSQGPSPRDKAATFSLSFILGMHSRHVAEPCHNLLNIFTWLQRGPLPPRRLPLAVISILGRLSCCTAWPSSSPASHLLCSASRIPGHLSKRPVRSCRPPACSLSRIMLFTQEAGLSSSDPLLVLAAPCPRSNHLPSLTTPLFFDASLPLSH